MTDDLNHGEHGGHGGEVSGAMGHESRPLVYLACPYSHPLRSIRFQRFQAANVAAAMLMVMRGELVFSPISHSHPVCEAVTDDETGQPQDWGYWERFDRAILSICRKVCVLPLPGWKESVGVQAEIAIAKGMSIEVEILPGIFVTGPQVESKDHMQAAIEEIAAAANERNE